MALNYIWIFFVVGASVVALLRWMIGGDPTALSDVVSSTFTSAKQGFEISLYLTGVLTLWMGLMKVGEAGGAVGLLSRAISPLLNKLFPGVPKGHAAYGSMTMNVAANMLGLDNAATPMGLKAMGELQELNPTKERASNAEIMFLVLNTSGLTIIPVTIMAYRQQCGAANPADIFLPLLLSTFISTLAGIGAVAVAQRINIFNRVTMGYLLLSVLGLGLLIWAMNGMEQERMMMLSTAISSTILLTIISSFIIMAMRRRVNVYDAFIEGAKGGFKTAVGIIPFLVAMLVGVGMFRASGALDFMLDGIRWMVNWLGADNHFVDALPTALMKPLSGSGARGFMIECMNTCGADSFAGRLSCMFQGAADTTFFILAVYFGSVGVKDTRHAVACGLIADLAGVIAAIGLAYVFFPID
ncbi:MAG: nucleoside recognition domain-containing protein [Bacteroidales bacterium]|nr:nucleoside recognition domain-containing protein [Bacteroidales bacterium]